MLSDRRLTPAVPAGAAFRLMRVIEPVVALRPQPAPDQGIDTELVFGETVRVFSEEEGWAYVQAERDRYVGYVSANALAAVGAPATHRVATLRTFIYTAPSIKSANPVAIPEGSLLTVVAEDDVFAWLDRGGYVYRAHVVPADFIENDAVAVAERYLGTPYLWGGRTSIGLDCSGLVQHALRLTGHDAPRDSDMLERFYPVKLDITSDLRDLRRGDAVFWKGHVGLMQDETRLIHANGHHMLVASEPLKQAADRILTKSFGPITSIGRLDAR